MTHIAGCDLFALKACGELHHDIQPFAALSLRRFAAYLQFSIQAMKQPEPEVEQLGLFLAEFNKESDRGAALVAAAMLDDRLKEVLAAFFLELRTSVELLSGFNAPLGTCAARASAAFALGLIQENELTEITLIRKVRTSLATNGSAFRLNRAG